MADPMPTAQEWQKKATGAVADRITVLLRVYHRDPNDTHQRRLALIDIDAACYEFCKTASPQERFVFWDLGLSACKAYTMQIDEAAKHGWDQVRKVFAPSHHAQGPTKTLQNHEFAINAKPVAKWNYWLEGVDPKHRSWGHSATTLFDEWLNSPTHLSFWGWLEANHKAEQPGVAYLGPTERWQHLCVFANDKSIYCYDGGQKGDHRIHLTRLSTHGMFTHHNGPSFAMFVCDPRGVFYTANQRPDHFHHSSFLSGKRVLAAGEWVVSDGRLLLLTNKTGHYGATLATLCEALKQLQNRIDITHTKIMHFAPGRPPQYFGSGDLLASGGDASKCRPLNHDFKALAINACAQGVDWEDEAQPNPQAYAGAQNLAPPVVI